MRRCLIVSKPSDLQEADLYEYRFDRFLFKREHIRTPCIFTLRPKNQGGEFVGSEREREELWHQILPFRPTYIDLEYNAGFTLPGRKLISYHNFDGTPLHFPKADKIACTAHSILDALRLLVYAREKRLLGIAMGPHGLITRLFAQPWSYIGPEALSMEESFHYDASLPLYGLIGGSVNQSVSHLTHNGGKICYIKMQVQKEELEEFLHYAHLFKGLSVTNPLKEAILPFVHPSEEARQIGAVNTLKIGRKIEAFNTDGQGALDALGSVRGKRIQLLGAGGAARAIAYEAKKRGASVAIINRDESRAAHLAKKWGLKLGWHDYDILINTTPLIPQVKAGATLFDIRSIPPINQLGEESTTIPGIEMFYNQAIAQFALWGEELTPLLKKRVPYSSLQESQQPIKELV